MHARACVCENITVFVYGGYMCMRKCASLESHSPITERADI